ncbi:ArsR/SmtB family transcription factor [Halorarius litoreus]|uniref:ArsR/SmtB family transcription factor n=1 Tax=Halorarius litoreus TaxID=2962676 RepID=UPI0020CE3413|nr:helix-turn-helix domain-containing protein [Halorarius litoreus]
MSSNSCSAVATPSAVGRSTRLDADSVLSAFNDDECRHILAAIASEPLTAAELHERHGLPLSTAYRKLERLADAGLVEGSLRLSRTGHHTTEYASVADDVVVRIEDGGVSVVLVTDAERSRPSARWR